MSLFYTILEVYTKFETVSLPEQRKYFKRSRKLLLAHMEKLKPEAKLAVERMLLFDRDLRQAYLLKEIFYQFMASSGSAEAKQRLLAFRAHASVAQFPEFDACLSVLRNWEPYILHSFDCTYSNDFTEDCNSKIKVLKRIAFGYRSFHRFRSRILLVQQRQETRHFRVRLLFTSLLDSYPNY